MKRFTMPLFAALALASVGTSALAQSSYTCENLGSFTLIGSSGDSDLTRASSGGSQLSIDLSTGDTLNISPVRIDLPSAPIIGDPVPALPVGVGSVFVESKVLPFGRHSIPTSLTATGDGRAGIFGLSGGEIRTSTRALGYYMTSATVTCVPAATEGGTEDLGNVSAFNQASTIMQGLGTLRGQTDGGRFEVTKGTAFGMSGDEGSGWRVWGYTDFRSYTDAAEGSSAGVTLGVDRDFGNLRAGLLLAYDMTTLNFGGGDESVTSLAIGPYVSGQAGPVSYDAFVTMSSPEYELLGGNVTGSRLTYGLRGSASYDMSFGSLAPFLSVNGATEEIGTDTQTSMNQAAGMVVNFDTQSGMTPYLSLAYTNNRVDNPLTGTSENQSVRVGLGFSQRFDNGGTFGLDIDSGEAIDGIRDVGVRLTYSMSF